MTVSDNRRVLFVVTNHGQLGDTGKETGYFTALLKTKL